MAGTGMVPGPRRVGCAAILNFGELCWSWTERGYSEGAAASKNGWTGGFAVDVEADEDLDVGGDGRAWGEAHLTPSSQKEDKRGT